MSLLQRAFSRNNPFCNSVVLHMENKKKLAEMFHDQANGDIEKVVAKFATPVDFNIQGAGNIPWIPEAKTTS